MSGRRRKALRAAFEKEHGRAPLKAEFAGYFNGGAGGPAYKQHDELRQIKRAHVRRRR